MGKGAEDIRTYRFGAADRLLFDANVWLYLYDPSHGPKDWRTRVYSQALKDILAAQSRIFLDVLVLSEFVNRSARLAYETLPSTTKPRDFKAFRNSRAFVPVAKAIANACRRIVGVCSRTESGFTTLDIRALLGEYETGRSDLNDQILVCLCSSEGLKLVTHDGDFRGANATVLTANKKLLTP